MKLILHKNHIYLPVGNNIVIKDADFNIAVKDDINLNDYVSTVYINGNAEVFNTYFTINITKLQTPYLDLKIVLTHRDTGETITYTSDKLPITRAVVLGQSSNEWYPSTMNSILERLALLENSTANNFNLVYEAIRELKNKGDVL